MICQVENIILSLCHLSLCHFCVPAFLPAYRNVYMYAR